MSKKPFLLTRIPIKKFLPYVAVWFIASLLGTYLRLYTLFQHIPFESSERATVLVLSNIRKSVIDTIDKNYPHLSVHEKNLLIKRSFDNILNKESKNIQKVIEKMSDEMGKGTSQITKGPYLLASDGYYYYSLTQNIAEKGQLGEAIKGSKYLNKLMLSPLGHWEPLNLHPYVGYWVYRLVKIFKPDSDLMFGVSFTPLFMTVLILIPFLLLCYLLNCRPLAAFVGSTLLLLAHIFLKRSIFAWYDNDSYSVFFPLVILCLLFYGLKSLDSKKHRIRFVLGIALTFTLYALFWHGWVFLLSVIGASGILLILYAYLFLKQKSTAKLFLQFFGFMILGTLGGITLTFGPKDFFILFAEGWKALNDFLFPKLSLWPDLYIGVGELEKPTLSYFVDLTGGYFYVGMALWGIFVNGVQACREPRSLRTFELLILICFLMASVHLAFGALRFSLLAVTPLGIFCVLGLNDVFNRIEKFIQGRFSDKQFSQLFSFTLIVVISLAVSLTSVSLTYRNIPLLLNKIFNTTWEKALVKINNETPPDSVINSWWPPGHFIKAVARRRVIFDGATINNPQGYWLANLLISDDERQAAGILRMLNNSANEAANYLQQNGMKLSLAVKLLKQIVKVSDEEAENILQPFLSTEKINHLLKLTHATPPPVYMLFYNDMIEKSIELKFVGGWNFEKVEELVADKDFLKNLPPKNSVAYIQLLWQIAGGAYRFSGILGQLSLAGDVLTFEHNVKVNLKTKSCYVSSSKYGKGVPQSIFHIDDDHLVETKLDNANLSYSVILTENNGLYGCVFLDRPLARSLVMRLYFLKGADLKYFRPFTQQTDLTRRTQLYVYEVDWKKFLEDIGE